MNERQICLAPDHCDTEDKATETPHSYQEEYQINLDRLINKDWQLYLNDNDHCFPRYPSAHVRYGGWPARVYEENFWENK